MVALLLSLALSTAPSAPTGLRTTKADSPIIKTTPGVTVDMTTKALCAKKWGKDRRHVTIGMKKTVAAKYGVDWSNRANYEFDHLVPRELGGADDINNLWPQPWPAAHKKDQLENRLHVLVCKGEMPLKTAQRAISTNWIAAYATYVRVAAKRH